MGFVFCGWDLCCLCVFVAVDLAQWLSTVDKNNVVLCFVAEICVYVFVVYRVFFPQASLTTVDKNDTVCLKGNSKTTANSI